MYRRRNILKPEDWSEEIKEWERTYQDPYHIKQRKTRYEWEMEEIERKERLGYILPIILLKEMEEKERELQDADGNFCGHYKKGEMDNDGLIVCLKCGVITGRHRSTRSVGYNFKNHVMKNRRK